MKPVIRKIVQPVHMGLGHDGLSALLRKVAKVDVKQLGASDLIMCLNNRGDKMKVIGGHGLVIGYLRLPQGQRIMKEALKYIPETFGSVGFDYDKAAKAHLDDYLSKKSYRRASASS